MVVVVGVANVVGVFCVDCVFMVDFTVGLVIAGVDGGGGNDVPDVVHMLVVVVVVGDVNRDSGGVVIVDVFLVP